MAIHKGQVELARLFIEHAPQLVNETNVANLSPLDFAIKKKQFDIIKIMLPYLSSSELEKLKDNENTKDMVSEKLRIK